MTTPTGGGRQPGLVVEGDVEKVGRRRRADATLGNSGRRRELIMVETGSKCARHVLGWVGRCGGSVEELQPAGDFDSNVNKVNGGGCVGHGIPWSPAGCGCVEGPRGQVEMVGSVKDVRCRGVWRLRAAVRRRSIGGRDEREARGRERLVWKSLCAGRERSRIGWLVR